MSPKAKYASKKSTSRDHSKRSTQRKYAPNRKSSRRKRQKQESNLEKKVSKESREAALKQLMKSGLSEVQALKLIRQMSTEFDRKELSHKWTNPGKYLQRLKKYNLNLKDALKGIWYLGLSLGDTHSPEHKNPYQSVDQGAAIVYLPGWLAVPRDPRKLEKALGQKVAYVASTDIDTIDKVITYAAKKHGRVKVVGFSDGQEVIRRYIAKYGDRKVDMFFSMAGNPFHSSSKRVTHVIGNKEALAIGDPGYTWLDGGKNLPKVNVVDGGHTFFVHDKKTIQQVADIIKSTNPTRAYNTVRSQVDPGLYRRVA